MYMRFVLISVSDDGFYHYDIFPEDKVEYRQTLIFNPVTKEVRENTFTEPFLKYLSHFTQHVTDENDNYRQELAFGWG